MQIAVDKIRPSPYQPRLSFELEDIRKSIIKDGIPIALSVRQKDDHYELIDGERRLRVAKELGYETVPCDVIDVDDQTARRLVWRVNTLQKPYNPKETAYHIKALKEQDLSLRAMAEECNYKSHHSVIAYLNMFKLPEQYQEHVWNSKIALHDILVLESLFESDGQRCPQVLIWLDKRLSGELKSSEELRKALHPTTQKLKEKRIKEAQKAVAKFEPEVGPLTTPENFEMAAKLLKERATRMRRNSMSPEELKKEENEKQRKKRETEEKKRQKELRLLEANTIETTKTKEDIEAAKARAKALVPEGGKTELERVLETSDLSLGVLERLPAAIRENPDKPIIEIARELHIEAAPGSKKPPARQPKPKILLTEWVSEVTKAGYDLINLLDKMLAGSFKKVAPKIEILRVDEMLLALEAKIQKYKG